MDKIEAFVNEQLKENVPEFNVGDTVRVHNRIKEGAKTRIQMYEGTVIAKRGGGISATFTVRRVSYGCGVEKTFPIHSPNVENVEVIRHGSVRRAKLFYLRDRVGKAAKVKEKICIRRWACAGEPAVCGGLPRGTRAPGLMPCVRVAWHRRAGGNADGGQTDSRLHRRW